jgi:hypothetical protein
MRSLNPDRLMLSTGSDTIGTGIVSSPVDLARWSKPHDGSLASGPLRVAGSVAYTAADNAGVTIVTLSDGMQITFQSVVARSPSAQKMGAQGRVGWPLPYHDTMGQVGRPLMAIAN